LKFEVFFEYICALLLPPPRTLCFRRCFSLSMSVC